MAAKFIALLVIALGLTVSPALAGKAKRVTIKFGTPVCSKADMKAWARNHVRFMGTTNEAEQYRLNVQAGKIEGRCHRLERDTLARTTGKKFRAKGLPQDIVEVVVGRRTGYVLSEDVE